MSVFLPTIEFTHVNLVSDIFIKNYQLRVEFKLYHLPPMWFVEIAYSVPLSRNTTCKCAYSLWHPCTVTFYLEVIWVSCLEVNWLILKPPCFFLPVSSLIPLCACFIFLHIVSFSKCLMCTWKEYVLCHF